MSTFRDWQPTQQPTALRGPFGTAWAESLGAHKDALVALAKDAVKARFVTVAPADALDHHSADRDMERGFSESAVSFRARLRGAWESWSWLGTRYGIGYAAGLIGYGVPAVHSWHSLPWDGDAARWARLLVTFTGVATFGSSAFGAVAYGGRDVQPIESADPLTARRQLRRTLRKWINARDRVEKVIVARGGARYGFATFGLEPYATLTTDEYGPPIYGAADAIYGTVPFGAFC